MFEDAISRIKGFVENAISTGYRGLIVLTNVNDYSKLLGVLGEYYDNILFVTSKRFEEDHGRVTRISPLDARKLLGYEYDSVLIDMDHGLEPNLVGIVGDMVRRGGVLVLASTRGYSDLRLGFRGGLSYYTSYLKKRFLEARNVLVIDLAENNVITGRVVKGKGVFRLVSLSIPGFRKALSEFMVTPSQYEWIKKFLSFMASGRRLLLGIGDRGRGKSAATGMALALGYVKGYYSEVPVIASSIYGVQSLFKFLIEVLKLLNVPYRAVVKQGLIWGVELRDGRIYYVEPWKITRGYRVVVIDEAAAIGISRLRNILSSSRKTIATTTIHGYEGTGHVSVKTLRSLIKARVEHLFREPTRYPLSDPLEEWLYDTFLLNVEPIEPRIDSHISYVVVDKSMLVGDYQFLRSIYGILILAHYRNEPNDLALLLDHPKHQVRILVNSNAQPLAVAQVSAEGPLSEEDVRILESGGNIPGVLLLDKVFKQGVKAYELILWRIVRIAVPPSIQRRGLGSKLLASIEGEAKSKGVDAIGAIFSGHEALGFWIKNGYRVFYISPRYNRITGEKNIAVIKALTSRAVPVVENTIKLFKRHLLLSASTVYRDLAAEKIALTLSSSRVNVELGICLDEIDVERLRKYLERKRLHESVYDSIHKAVLLYLAQSSFNLDSRELIAVIARSLQGKSMSEVAKILDVSSEEALRIVDKAYRMIVESILSSMDNYRCRI